jgi:hypothetical protein
MKDHIDKLEEEINLRFKNLSSKDKRKIRLLRNKSEKQNEKSRKRCKRVCRVWIEPVPFDIRGVEKRLPRKLKKEIKKEHRGCNWTKRLVVRYNEQGYYRLRDFIMSREELEWRTSYNSVKTCLHYPSVATDEQVIAWLRENYTDRERQINWIKHRRR